MIKYDCSTDKKRLQLLNRDFEVFIGSKSTLGTKDDYTENDKEKLMQIWRDGNQTVRTLDFLS